MSDLADLPAEIAHDDRVTNATRHPAAAALVVLGVAVSLLALHATTEAFLAPEPGTSASDHVLRWVGSLVLLLAALVVARRGPDGVRAIVALVLGVLALEAALLAIADALAGGARGDDWTGFLVAPVGPVLLGLGAVLLWRSRKPHGRRYGRRALLAAASVLAVYWLVLPLVIAIAATHRPRSDPEPPSLGVPYETVTITTEDGLELAGWYVPSMNGAAIVSFPTRSGKVPQARMLARNGYGVLLLDMRGYDGSEGDPNMFGWGAAKDLDAAVEWLRRRPDVDDGRIGGLGFSVGGEVLLEAAAANERIRAVVSEGAGVRSVREALLRGPAGWLDLPREATQTAALAVLSATAPSVIAVRRALRQRFRQPSRSARSGAAVTLSAGGCGGRRCRARAARRTRSRRSGLPSTPPACRPGRR